jgi:type I restriction enzyme S subunit
MIKARLKYIIKTQKGKVPTKFSDDNTMPPYLTMDYLRGKYDNILYVKPKVEYKLIDEDEVIVLYDGANAGEVMLSKKGFLSSTMAIVTPKNEFFEKRFLFYFLKSVEGELKKASTGTTIPHLDQNFLFNTHFEFPEVEVQKPISDFLDEKSTKINHFIKTKQHFIELLKEQRQSIITNAVTKGIDENAKMNVTVLGEIPEHWKVRRLGTIGRFSKGCNISRSELIYTDEGVPAILYGDIYTKYDIVAENIINRITKETAAKSIELKKGDLLFTGSGETKEDIGKCVVFNSNEPAYAGGDVIIFKQEVFDSYFISYSQNSSIAKYQKAISSKGEIIVHTYGSKLRDVFMPYPPTIDEQKQIVEHIKIETRTLDIAINKAEREIELIKEYREAMIAEAVMGKMKI